MIDEDWMLNGNQLEEKEGVIYHYMQVRCFSTTSTLLKSITPHKTTGVLYSDIERLALTLSADLFQIIFCCLLGDLCAYK